MALNILRGLFVLLMAAVGYSFVVADPETVGEFQSVNWLALSASLITATGMIILDIAAGRRKLVVFSAIAFGTLIGLVITYALSLGVALLINTFVLPGSADNPENRALISFTTLLIGCASCYFAVSFILQTKDDFRFIIPYVEFRRDARGSRPALLDTSVLVDGRITPILEAGFLDVRFVVPQFVIRELQRLADSGDEHKRARGRRGLDVLDDLRHRAGADVRIYEPHEDAHGGSVDAEPDNGEGSPGGLRVDDRLVRLADELDAKLVTLDFNLAKVARLSDVSVLNFNDLALALRPEALPGTPLSVQVEKPGTGENQGVGHLPDGTMIVVEGGADRVGGTVQVIVRNTTQTAAGRLIFAKVINAEEPDARDDDEPPARRRRRRLLPNRRPTPPAATTTDGEPQPASERPS